MCTNFRFCNCNTKFVLVPTSVVAKSDNSFEPDLTDDGIRSCQVLSHTPQLLRLSFLQNGKACMPSTYGITNKHQLTNMTAKPPPAISDLLLHCQLIIKLLKTATRSHMAPYFHFRWHLVQANPANLLNEILLRLCVYVSSCGFCGWIN